MQDRGYGVPRISLPGGWVKEGTKREAWSTQGPRAQGTYGGGRRRAALRRTCKTVGGYDDEDERQTCGCDPRTCAWRPHPNGLQRTRARQGPPAGQHRLGRERGGLEPDEGPTGGRTRLPEGGYQHVGGP